MYKTIIAKYSNGLFGRGIGMELQAGNGEALNQLLNSEYESGWELVSMTTSPWRTEPACCNYVLIFKKRSN